MNLIEHIADHLDFEGIGVLSTKEHDGNIFWGHLPDAPEEAIVVNSTDSQYPGSETGARIQIMCRGKVGDTRIPYELACRISELLADYTGFLHGDGPYVQIEVMSTALGAGLDKSGREYYTNNYRVKYCDWS